MTLVPLLVSMVGLPTLLTFVVQIKYFPIRGDPSPQHFFLLGLLAWLVTVGPKYFNGDALV